MTAFESFYFSKGGFGVTNKKCDKFQVFQVPRQKKCRNQPEKQNNFKNPHICMSAAELYTRESILKKC